MSHRLRRKMSRADNVSSSQVSNRFDYISGSSSSSDKVYWINRCLRRTEEAKRKEDDENRTRRKTSAGLKKKRIE